MSPQPTPLERLVESAVGREPKALGPLLDRLDAAGLVREVRPGGAAATIDDVAGTDIVGLTEDSRQVRAGTLFVAVPGFHVDGHDFVERAAAAGAAAAVVERPVPGTDLPQVVVGAARSALAQAAGWWAGDPSRGIGVIGVTGTDGKTTTSFLVVAALEAAGISTGLIGTVETKV
ncbi:MAG: Mur ligase domain-containing protein, partial [Chloroflexi bacterium]|nr:Mur ligase domain-containing protein [Chloroflexota bacterium]